MAALSYISRGIAWSPARAMMKLKPRPLQTVVRATAGRAVLASVSRLVARRPRTRIIHSKSRTLGLKTKDQITPALATETATVLVKMVRNRPIRLSLARASSARASADASESGTTIRANFALVRRLLR